jgi:hypothetical protein
MAVADRWHLSRGQTGQVVCREHGLALSPQHGQGDRWQDGGVTRAACSASRTSPARPTPSGTLLPSRWTSYAAST